MFVLDTDHISLVERAESAEAKRIYARLEKLAPEERATTIISFEEQGRGWLTYLSQARSLVQQIEAYRRWKRQLEFYCHILILDFDETAATEFQQLRKSRIRVKTMDLKIAAVVLAQRATLVSRNVSDFGKIPGLKVEDWTKP